jgi:hypothetical protein
MKRISIQQAIINAVEESDASAARFQNQMMKWAKYIEREIGSKLGYKYKAKTYTVTGCTIDLPDDCYLPVRVIKGDYEDECNAKYMASGFTEVSSEDRDEDDYSWLWTPMEVKSVEEPYWEEIAEQINFVNKYTNTDMTLIYKANEMDPNGFWIVNESHIDAITKFIIFKFAKKFKWKIFKSDKLLRVSHRDFVLELERDYNIAVRHARVEDARASTLDTAQY